MKYHEAQSIDQTILDASQELLERLGAEFTIQDLATATGMSRATLYRRIGSKEALLERLSALGTPGADQPDTRTRILQAARQAFGTRGLLTTTMDDIAETAGVGVATVYRHFGDKDQLVQSFAADLPYAALAELAMHPSADVRGDLRTLLQSLIPFLEANRDIFRIVMSGNQAEITYLERMRQGTVRFRDHLQAYFAAQQAAGRLRAMGAPYELAQALLGMLMGFLIVGNQHFDQPPAATATLVELVLGIFLDGLLPSTEESQ